MSEHKNKAYPLRLDDTIREKIKYIADKENRKLSQQYEIIINDFVNEYESINGPIILNEDDLISPLIQAYAHLVIANYKSIEDVPIDIRNKVEEYIKKDTD